MLNMNWVNKLQIKVIDEEDGGCTICIDWDNTDPELEEWTSWGEKGQKSFIIDALTTALECYI